MLAKSRGCATIPAQFGTPGTEGVKSYELRNESRLPDGPGGAFRVIFVPLNGSRPGSHHGPDSISEHFEGCEDVRSVDRRAIRRVPGRIEGDKQAQATS